MATKSAFTASINALLTGVISIVSKHRPSMLIVTDELWKTPLIDNSATTNVVTVAFGNYYLKFKKVGNTVYVDGIIINTLANPILANTIFATFTNSEFLPRAGDEYHLTGINKSASSNATMIFLCDASGIKSLKGMGTSAVFSINGFYTTND